MIGPVNNQFIIDKKTDCIIAEVGKDIIDKAIKDAAESETEVDKEAVQTDITEPVVFDMELAHILALGFTNVKSTKIVSDTLNFEEYEHNVEKEG